MTLTVFDPRTGTKVVIWYPDLPVATHPTPGQVLPLRPSPDAEPVRTAPDGGSPAAAQSHAELNGARERVADSHQNASSRSVPVDP